MLGSHTNVLNYLKTFADILYTLFEWLNYNNKIMLFKKIKQLMKNNRTFIFSFICMLTEFPSYVQEPSRNEQVCSPNGQLVKSTSQNTRYLAGGIQWTCPPERTTQLIFPYVSSWCPSALWNRKQINNRLVYIQIKIFF